MTPGRARSDGLCRTVARWLFPGSFILTLPLAFSFAQTASSSAAQVFSHSDTLRGMLTPERRCYDVRFYDMDVTIDPARRTIAGSNVILFSVDSSFDRMQIDLFANLQIDTITLDGDPSPLPYRRDSNACFVQLSRKLEQNTVHRLRVAYSGQPVEAKNPPWQGGFTWGTDSASGHPWVVVTCEGIGASLWWPNKDHLSDKPDSMQIGVTVPDSLMDVSNGRLRAVTPVRPGWTRYTWFVSYPINNYNVTVNIGAFSHFSDQLPPGRGRETLALDYYVLPGHLERARKQFRQVKPMLAAYEKFFGPYPFVRDGYKLIEAPHNGMEHQSAVAYGNGYLEGYRGRSSSDIGLEFDFIIVHESAHEWWGNSVTGADAADMWIHESFSAYAEALFVEEQFGREASLRYINAKKQNVRNHEPIVGIYDVQHEGSSDMYDKGQLALNTLRSIIDNDGVWFSMLRGIQEKFRYRSISYDSIVDFVNRTTGTDYSTFFRQYLKFPKLPKLEAIVSKKGGRSTARVRWVADVPGFQMPVRITTSRNHFEFIRPASQWQTIDLHGMSPEDFRVDEASFYVDVSIRKSYIDPAAPE